MRGDLGSALVRAYVRGERVKRAHGPRSSQWRRWIYVVRPHIYAQMTEREQLQALELVKCERIAHGGG